MPFINIKFLFGIPLAFPFIFLSLGVSSAFAAPITGNGTSTFISVFSGATTITGFSSLKFDNSAGLFTVNGTSSLQKVTFIAASGTTLDLSDLTPGSVLFTGGNGRISQDNANFFWDSTNLRLGIGSASPFSPLSIQRNPVSSATSTALLLGLNFIVAGNANGTFIGANPTSTSIDFINFQEASTTKFQVLAGGIASTTELRAPSSTIARLSFTSATGTTIHLKTNVVIDSNLKIERGNNAQNGMIKFLTAGTDDWILGQRNTNDSDFHLWDAAPSNDVLVVQRSTGNVGIGIGNTNPNATLSVLGNFVVTGSSTLSTVSIGSSTLANQIGSFVSASGTFATVTLGPIGSPTSTATTTVAIPTAQTGDPCYAGHSQATSSVPLSISCLINAPNTALITLINLSSADVTITAGVIRIIDFRLTY